MFYPEGFKERVKAAYPGLPKLYEYLESGDRLVRQFLEDGISMPKGEPFEEIFEQDISLEELEETIRAHQERVELLEEWKELDREDRRKLFIHHMG